MHHPHKSPTAIFPLHQRSPSLACNLVDCVALILERTHSGPRICSFEQMAVEGGVSYMTWTARLSSPLPRHIVTVSTSLGLREHAFAAMPGKTTTSLREKSMGLSTRPASSRPFEGSKLTNPSTQPRLEDGDGQLPPKVL